MKLTKGDEAVRMAICDGDEQSREQLSLLLQAGLVKRSVSYSVEHYARGRDLVYAVQDGERFEVIFLDVTDEAALQTAHRLREYQFDGELIFTASSAAFAVAGYEVGASGYLIKPYRAEALSRLLARLSDGAHTACLTVRSHHTWVRIPYHEIVYAESQNSKCIVHRADGARHTVYCRLQEIETMLGDDERFLRCHQSYLVNMDHIVKIDRQFEVSGGDTVCIRQRDIRRIREHYLRYIERVTAKV